MLDRRVDWSGASDSRDDVVVVGGGIVGICVALYLQRSGRKVRVIERDVPGDSASGHNGGVLAVAECVPVGTPGVVRAVPRMLVDPLSPLAIRWSYLPRLAPWLARFLWASQPRRVEDIARTIYRLTSLAVESYQPLLAGSEAETLVRAGGMIEGFREERTFQAAQADLDLRSRHGSVFEVLDGDAVAELDPLLKGRFRHAVHYSRWSYTIHPGELTLALCRQFTDNGGQLQQGAVDGFRVVGSRVQAALCDGREIRADDFVIAAGAWSRRLVRSLGFDVPLDTERGYGVDFPDPGFTLNLPVVCADHHYGLTPLGSGMRLVGTSELAGLTAPPNFKRTDSFVRAAHLTFPELGGHSGRAWMGFRPSTPDSLPVIGRSPHHNNAFLAFGHGHKGLGQAAITGRLITEIMNQQPTSLDVHPLRPTRFGGLGRLRSELSA